MTDAVEAARVALDAAREEQAKAQGYHARKVAEAEQALADAKAAAPTDRPFLLPLEVTVPLNGDEFTQSALDDMVGATPTITVRHDWQNSLGRGTVERAEVDEVNLRLWVAMEDAVADRVVDRIGKPESYGIGYQSAETEFIGDDGEHRRFKRVTLHEVSLSPVPDESPTEYL